MKKVREARKAEKTHLSTQKAIRESESDRRNELAEQIRDFKGLVAYCQNEFNVATYNQVEMRLPDGLARTDDSKKIYLFVIRWAGERQKSNAIISLPGAVDGLEVVYNEGNDSFNCKTVSEHLSGSSVGSQQSRHFLGVIKRSSGIEI